MDFIAEAKKLNKTIVLPESTEERTLKATEILLNDKITKVILVGDEKEIKDAASKCSANIEEAKIIDPKTYEKTDEYINKLLEKRKAKGMTEEKAKQKDLGALLIPGGILIGLGFGLLSGNLPAYMFLGLGMGFVGWVIVSIMKK